MEPRVHPGLAGAFFIAMAVFGWAVVSAFRPQPPIGIAVVAMFLSSLLWLLASFVAVFRTDASNALNAAAAAIAAYAGISTIDHGARHVWDLVTGRTASSDCLCVANPPTAHSTTMS